MTDQTLFVAGDPLAGPAAPPPPQGIKFTQYLLPDGRTQPQWIQMGPEIEAKADQIAARGYRFEMEVLSDYVTCSFTIHDPDKGEDVAIKLCPNGPAVPGTISDLINEFHAEMSS